MSPPGALIRRAHAGRAHGPRQSTPPTRPRRLQRARIFASDQQAVQDEYNKTTDTRRASVAFRTGVNHSTFMSAALEESSRAALSVMEPGLRLQDMRSACALHLHVLHLAMRPGARLPDMRRACAMCMPVPYERCIAAAPAGCGLCRCCVVWACGGVALGR